jgi:hypothetical protein
LLGDPVFDSVGVVSVGVGTVGAVSVGDGTVGAVSVGDGTVGAVSVGDGKVGVGAGGTGTIGVGAGGPGTTGAATVGVAVSPGAIGEAVVANTEPDADGASDEPEGLCVFAIGAIGVGVDGADVEDDGPSGACDPPAVDGPIDGTKLG